MGVFALAAYAGVVFLVTRFFAARLPGSARRWAGPAIAVVLAVLPFADELYNEQQTRLACEAGGGMAVSRTLSVRSRDEGLAQIKTVRLDSEEPHYWKHEMLFLHRGTGDELGRLRWYDRKHGWLQGNAPGAGYAAFLKGSACPDPQPLLANGAAREQLIRVQ